MEDFQVISHLKGLVEELQEEEKRWESRAGLRREQEQKWLLFEEEMLNIGKTSLNEATNNDEEEEATCFQANKSTWSTAEELLTRTSLTCAEMMTLQSLFHSRKEQLAKAVSVWSQKQAWYEGRAKILMDAVQTSKVRMLQNVTDMSEKKEDSEVENQSQRNRERDRKDGEDQRKETSTTSVEQERNLEQLMQENAKLKNLLMESQEQETEALVQVHKLTEACTRNANSTACLENMLKAVKEEVVKWIHKKVEWDKEKEMLTQKIRQELE